MRKSSSTVRSFDSIFTAQLVSLSELYVIPAVKPCKAYRLNLHGHRGNRRGSSSGRLVRTHTKEGLVRDSKTMTLNHITLLSVNMFCLFPHGLAFPQNVPRHQVADRVNLIVGRRYVSAPNTATS